MLIACSVCIRPCIPCSNIASARLMAISHITQQQHYTCYSYKTVKTTVKAITNFSNNCAPLNACTQVAKFSHCDTTSTHFHTVTPRVHILTGHSNMANLCQEAFSIHGTTQLQQTDRCVPWCQNSPHGGSSLPLYVDYVRAVGND